MKKVVIISTSQCYEKCSLKAHLFCGGVGGPKEIEGNAELQEAYELGKQV